MSESERQRTLEELFESKKDVGNLLEKLPIGSSTLTMQKRRRELEEKLLRIDRAIETFSKKTVYIAL
jgi:Calmodulin-binding